MKNWNIQDSKKCYNIDAWGAPYFDVNHKGNMVVRPRAHSKQEIDLKEVVDSLREKGVQTPVLLRFGDILDARIKQLSSSFKKASDEAQYKGAYYTVYPIKVNQQRPVLEEIMHHGNDFNIGLEAGSKPELHAVIAATDNPNALIICNGYKDDEFIELALLTQKMGKRVYLVVEKLNELPKIATIAQGHALKPNIGIRIKLSSPGSGKWQNSGGDYSKFGLNASELLEAIDYLRKHNLLDCLKLLHVHIGSQVTDIQSIKSAFKEVAQFYVELSKMGCAISFIDIGGGMGIDYDGSKSSSPFSINYGIQEYANDAIWILKDAADKENLPHPSIISESGRALTAHHSILVFDVLETSSHPFWPEGTTPQDDAHSIIHELHTILATFDDGEQLEKWHDAQQMREDSLALFRLSHFSLTDHALMQRLFWSIAQKAKEYLTSTQATTPPSLDILHIENLLAEKYFCNFSLFQSLPDSWAIDQVFPIVPLSRLTEEPTQRGTLQDITCDSDGTIKQYIVGTSSTSKTLPLHPLVDDEPYYLATFLVGAYQETLGDLHNLFGDTNVVHLSLQKEGGYSIKTIIKGETVKDLLGYVQFDSKKLLEHIRTLVQTALDSQQISAEEGRYFLKTYQAGLEGYTYLE